MPAPLLLCLPLSLSVAPVEPPCAHVVDDADDQYHFIVGLAEKDLHDLVVREATVFLAKYASHGRALLVRYRLASALFDLARLDEARAHYAELAKERDFRFATEVSFRLGQCELERGANQAAAQAFRAVLAGGEEYLRVPATYLLGEALFREQDYAGAHERFAAVAAVQGTSEYTLDAAHGLAWCAYRLSDLDGAVQRAEEFRRRWPEDERAGELAFLAGEAHLEAGRPRQAGAVYALVEDGPFHDAALRGQGFAAAALGDHAGAARGFGELLDTYPRSRYAAEASLHRGVHLLQAGDPRAALAAWKAHDPGPGAEAHFWRGRAQAELGAAEEALAALDRALAAEPAPELRARIQVARADALFDLGRTDDAAAVYEAAGSDYALHAAAVARLNDGAAEDAVRLARRLLADEGGGDYRDEGRLTLGEGLFALERYDEARQTFELVAREDPDAARKARALARCGWCSYLSGDPRAALASFRAVGRAHADSDEAPEALFMAGRCAEETRDADGARAAFAAYAARHADGPHAAEALLRLGRLEPGEPGASRLRAVFEQHAGSPFAIQARFDLAERLSQAGEYAPAAELYGALVTEHGAHELAPAAQYGLGWCRYALEDYTSASQALRAAAGNRDADPGVRLSALELLVWSERDAHAADGARDAFTAFARVCDDEPRRLRAARVAAKALEEADRRDDAQALYDALLRGTRDKTVALAICVERAYLFLDAGDPGAAERQLRAAHQYAPDDPDLAQAFFFVGEAVFDGGANTEAAALYDLAAAAGAPDVQQRALYKGGFALLRAEDLAGACARFQRLVEQHAACDLYGESLFLLGEARFRQGAHADAVTALERLRRELPSHATMPKALFRLGVAHAHAGAWKDAGERLAELLQKHPDFENAVEAELWRGRALAHEGRSRGARQSFERVIEQDRGVLSARARIELGRLALGAGDGEEALSQFLKVAVLYAHDEEVAEALYLAGQVLEAQDDRARAETQYAEAATKHGETRFGKLAKERLAVLRK
jgi:TolA-binding protein